MHADADDLISSGLVELVRKINHPIGCVLKQGYVMDYSCGKILPCPSDHISVSSFDRYCGTSIIYTLHEFTDPQKDCPMQLEAMDII